MITLPQPTALDPASAYLCVCVKPVLCLNIFCVIAAQAVSLDFSASGDPITHTDNATPPTCMLGLRVAARNLFHCSLPDMQQHLPVHLRQLFTLQGVTRLLARQKRESLGLSTDAVILQVITVDDMQLLSQQSKALQMSSGVLASEMVTELAGWMIAGNRTPPLPSPPLLLPSPPSPSLPLPFPPPSFM